MLLIVLRLAHVFFGALWVGFMTFQVLFLSPALAEVGPDGARADAMGKVVTAMLLFTLAAMAVARYL